MEMIDASLFGRTNTIVETMRYMKSIDAKVMVEIGGCRSMGGQQGDGHSTVAWGEYQKEYDLEIHTVDIDAAAQACCRELTKSYDMNYHNTDAEAFVKSFDKKIDFFYLDGVPPEFRFTLIREILAKMADKSLILFDDIEGQPPLFGDELMLGAFAIPYMMINGYSLIFAKERQVLLGRGL